MPKPDLYVYLHADTATLLKNIEIRGRDYEQDIEAYYLENIKDGYINYLKHINDFPIVIVDTNNVDFIHNQEQYNRIKEVIFNSDYKLGINRVIL